MLLSLLTDGPETLTVYPEHHTTDAEGNPVAAPDFTRPVTVPGCWVFPLDTTEDHTTGQRSTERYRVYTQAAPVTAWSAVDWRGQRYEVDGEPQQWQAHPPLHHVRATIKKAG
ncbi:MULTISPECIES: hypothetical protein [unclassified Crossiella]|uniref:hypothetical protein n=1 Tax=unclassified Crossiella TaxID=2620835 RepID=UPI001FFE9980|nr:MULTISPECIES: hypothetical protein [unclassified Crossiella]MCK2242323.1 hypothetical protein [Crossiella sp. S99.2]MCK2254646.1 hypothetical protein [Crossiella sp. S99.1]